MARKRRHQEHQNHERWLISYADFITLLFAFFVVMFATSQTDKTKVQQVSQSVKEALESGTVKAVAREVLGGTVDELGKGNAMMKGPGGTEKVPPKPVPIDKTAIVTDLLPSMKFLTQSLAREIKDGKVDVHLETRGLVVSLRQHAFFPSGGDDVGPEAFASMEKIAAAIKELPNPIRLEGHTDAIPIHNTRFRSNMELSAARSIAMLEVLCGKYGVDRQRVAIAGFADTAPVDSNDTEEGRSHNRRVDLVILNQAMAVNNQPSQKPSPAAPQNNASPQKQ